MGRGNAFFTYEFFGSQQGDAGFLASLRDDADLHPAFLYVDNRVRAITLRKDACSLGPLDNRLAQPRMCEEVSGAETFIALAGGARCRRGLADGAWRRCVRWSLFPQTFRPLGLL